LESGLISYRPSVWTPSTAQWGTLVAALNCTGPSNLTCVRDAPADTIKSIIEHQELTFNPIVDNITVIANPAQARNTGNIANIPVLVGSNSQEGRVFVVGTTNLTEFFEEYFAPFPALWDPITKAYSGLPGLETPYDIASQIFTEVYFQCVSNHNKMRISCVLRLTFLQPAALFANRSAAVGIPSWRYFYNVTFPNVQQVVGLDLGDYHSSEIPMVFSTYYANNATAQEVVLSSFMRGAWAQFAKNPWGGPGWNPVGSGGNFANGYADLDLGSIGSDGSSGVEVIRQREVDSRCSLFQPVYDAVFGG
jgi:carboxylesterase type B